MYLKNILNLSILILLSFSTYCEINHNINCKKIALNEYLNRNWKNELVNYKLNFKSSSCVIESIDLESPDGAVPFQISGTEYYPGTKFVKSCTLSFVTDLAARERKTYTVNYGPTPAAKSQKNRTDVKIISSREDHYDILSNGSIEVKVPNGNRQYAKPESPENVPSPIMGIRGKNGQWFGTGLMFGKHKMSAYESQVISGPVFAEANIIYHYADQSTLKVKVRVVLKQNAVFIETDSSGNFPDCGWNMVLAKKVSPAILSIWAHGDGKWRKWNFPNETFGHVKLADKKPGELYRLAPFKDWWDGHNDTVFVLRVPKLKQAIALGSYDFHSWIKPEWEKKFSLKPAGTLNNELRTFKDIPLIKDKSGKIILHCSNKMGVRKWYIAPMSYQAGPDDNIKKALAVQDGKYGCQTLDMIKDYALIGDFDKKNVNPHLYVSRSKAPEMQKELKKNKHLENSIYRYFKINSKRKRVAGRKLFQFMVDTAYGKNGRKYDSNFDFMRHSWYLLRLYDLLLGAGNLSREERELLTAQMAFLGYTLDYIWDVDKGFSGDSNNMWLSFVCQLALTACLLPDHPQARAWFKKGRKWVKIRLDEKVGENGVWLPENLHYACVSLENIMAYALAVKAAGFEDITRDEKLKNVFLYLAKQLTPPDVRLGNLRFLPPEYRNYRAERTGLLGKIALATATNDPDYSKALQWAWNQENNVDFYSEAQRMGGYEKYIENKQSPARMPAWSSEKFPGASVILREAFGSPEEYGLYLPLARFGDYYRSQPGAFNLYALGKPLSVAFNGSYELFTYESFLANRVDLARVPGTVAERARNAGTVGDARIRDFSSLPGMDYTAEEFRLSRAMSGPAGAIRRLEKKFPLPKWPRPAAITKGSNVVWTRQVLFVKNRARQSCSYYIFRDTVKGNQPTVCNFWFLTEKIVSPEDAKNRRACLADAPGNKSVPVRKLTGSRFTGLGQFGVDIELFVAHPCNSPAHTLRWGYSIKKGFQNRDWHEYQDLLQLQLPGAGYYYLAVYPRPAGDLDVPRFDTVGNGKIIRMQGNNWTDYCLLSDIKTKAAFKDIRITGYAACIQNRENTLTISLGAAGQVAYKGYVLSANGPVSMNVKGLSLVLNFANDTQKPIVDLAVPPGYSLESVPIKNGKYRIAIPDNERLLTLHMKKIK